MTACAAFVLGLCIHQFPPSGRCSSSNCRRIWLRLWSPYSECGVGQV